jgi:hypothetical protein
MRYALHAASILADFRKSFKVDLRVWVGVKIKEPRAIHRQEGKAVRHRPAQGAVSGPTAAVRGSGSPVAPL